VHCKTRKALVYGVERPAMHRPYVKSVRLSRASDFVQIGKP